MSGGVKMDDATIFRFWAACVAAGAVIGAAVAAILRGNP